MLEPAGRGKQNGHSFPLSRLPLEPAVRLLLVCLAVLVSMPLVSAAQQPANKAKAAVIDPAQADADFAYQGEYSGWCWRGRGWMWSGLQVVAIGDGKFDGVFYRGGLPGQGWDRTPPEKLSGHLDDDLVSFQGPVRHIQIARQRATLTDDQNRALGQLAKVERSSPTMGATPPSGATMLFNVGQVPNLPDQNSGQVKKLPHLSGAKLAPDGTLLAGVLTTMPVDAFHMHLEFRTPYMPHARGQGRGNSGVYIQQRYEVQILDSFGLAGLDNECGGLYKQTRPDINMCLPPLAWQTYDIWFTPPRFAADGKTKLTHSLLTVLHNGVAIHWYRPVTAKTGGGRQEGPEPFPINLQEHGNPVTFRNIWIEHGDGHAIAYCPPTSHRRGLLRRR
jgi:hypothetical protein